MRLRKGILVWREGQLIALAPRGLWGFEPVYVSDGPKRTTHGTGDFRPRIRELPIRYRPFYAVALLRKAS